MTHAEIDALDGDALRIAVAESLGWRSQLIDTSIPSIKTTDWPHDLNAAIRDLVETVKETHGVSLHWVHSVKQWKCESLNIKADSYIVASHPDRLAEAICRWHLKRVTKGE